MKLNLISFFVIFIYSSVVNAGFTKNEGDLNSFTYQGMGFNNKEIVINGFTLIENISDQSTNALIANSDLVPIDQSLEIEIEHVQAIQIFNSSQDPYNQRTAFLVRTTDRRILLHIEIAKSVSIVQNIPLYYYLGLLSSNWLYSPGDSASSNIPIGLDLVSGTNAGLAAQALGGTTQPPAYICSTIELQESMFNGQQLSIPELTTFRYNIIDESNYSTMPLTNGSRRLRMRRSS